MEINVADLKRNPGAQIKVKLGGFLPSLGGEGEQEAKPISPLTAELRIKNVDNVILVEGTLWVQVSLCCSRCLEEFTQELEVNFSEAYGEQGGPHRTGTEQEDGIIPFSGDTIDLTGAIRENILAALPMKAICREDCQGLCPRCGRNLNRGECGCPQQEPDPRLAILGKLLETE